MGNSQSTSNATNRPHRLTKPQTRSFKSTLLSTSPPTVDPSPSSPISPSTKEPGTEVSNAMQDGQGRNEQNTQHKPRSQIFGKASAPDQGSQEIERDWHSSLESLVSSVKRLSRSGSLTSQIPSARASAIHLVNSSGRTSRLSQVAEGTKLDLEESDRVLQSIKDKAEMDEQTARTSQRFSVILEEDDPVEVTRAPAPIRRRSLYTPGIATRGRDILRKPPPSDVLIDPENRDYYFSPQHPETLQQVNIASLDLADEGRSGTPVHQDYSHLGSFKLGTLRVTNGTASPVPSERTIQSMRLRHGRSTPDLRKDGRFSASEGPTNDDNGTKEGSPFSSEESWHHPVESVYVLPRAAWKEDESHAGGRAGSPLRFLHSVSAAKNETEEEAPTHILRPVSLSDRPQLSPDGAFSIAQEYISETVPQSSDVATNIVDGNVSDLPAKRFSFEQSPSPMQDQFQVTSKATEYDDRLFEDEGIFASPVEETMDSSDYFKSEGHTKHGGESELPDVPETSKANETLSVPARSNGRAPVKPLSKTDSGYSSSASLRSVRKSMSKDTRKSDVHASISAESTEGLSDKAEAASMRKSTPVQPQPVQPTRPSLRAKSRPESQLCLPLLGSHHASTDSIQTRASASSNLSTGSTTPKKLHKTRPSRPLSQPVPVEHITVQKHQSLSQTHIPLVPVDVATRHAERLQNFPLLDHTYPTLNHTRSFESMSTTARAPYVPIRFPSPEKSSPSDDEGDERRRRPPPQRIWRAFQRSKSERRVSQRQSQVVTLPPSASHIDGFDGITQTLGSSYDVARKSIEAPPRNDQRRSMPDVPRGRKPQRVKNVQGMDAEEAARLARSRSRTLAERSELPFSMKQKLFNDRGGIPGRQQQSTSHGRGVPPLPTFSSERDEGDRVHVMTTAISKRYTLSALPQPPAKSSRRPVMPKIITTPPMAENIPLPPLTNPSNEEAIEIGDSWEVHRQAWRQRRKSAGETLARQRSLPSIRHDMNDAYSLQTESASIAKSYRASLIDLRSKQSRSVSPPPPPPSIPPGMDMAARSDGD